MKKYQIVLMTCIWLFWRNKGFPDLTWRFWRSLNPWQGFHGTIILYIFGRKVAENGKDNLKSILSPVHITLEYLTWDRQMFQYHSIEKHLSTNYQNIMKQLQQEWPKLAKEYIYKLDQRINEQADHRNHQNDIDINIGNSNLAPDLQRRLILRYLNLKQYRF